MKTRAISLLMLAAALSASISLMRSDGYGISDHEWGSLLEKVKSMLPAGTESLEFAPAEKPEYKNRILSYITAIDNKLIEKIVILRAKTEPETDYLFVNNKLYSVIENWEDIDQATEKKLMAELKKQFGEPHVQKDNNFYIYSYDGKRTKVLCYLMKAPGSKATCKIYFYTKNLFRLLISE